MFKDEMRCRCSVAPAELDPAAVERAAEAVHVPVSWLVFGTADGLELELDDDGTCEPIGSRFMLEQMNRWQEEKDAAKRIAVGRVVAVDDEGRVAVQLGSVPPLDITTMPRDELDDALERSIEWLREVVSSVTDETLAELAEPERTLVLETRKHLWEYDRAKRAGGRHD